MKQIITLFLALSSLFVNAQVDYIYMPPYDLMQQVLEKKQREYDRQNNNTQNTSDVTCQKIYDAVVRYGDKIDSVNPISSTMLIKATYYELKEYKFVVAYFKEDKYDITGSPYIFCGIPKQDWDNFKSDGLYNSYGKAFHKYIFHYKCDCE